MQGVRWFKFGQTLWGSLHAAYDFLSQICKQNRLGLDQHHYNGVIMGAMASQITSLAIVYSTIYSGADQRKHQSSASLAFVRGIHRWPVNSPHKGPVARKMFPSDDVIMINGGQDKVHGQSGFGTKQQKIERSGLVLGTDVHQWDNVWPPITLLLWF